MNCNNDRFTYRIDRLNPARILHTFTHLNRSLGGTLFLDVCPGAKSPLTFSTDHYDVNFGIIFQTLEGRWYTCTDSVVDGVDLTRTGKYYPSDRPVTVHLNCFVDYYGQAFFSAHVNIPRTRTTAL